MEISKLEKQQFEEYIRYVFLEKNLDEKKTKHMIVIKRYPTYNKIISKMKYPLVIIKYIISFLEKKQSVKLCYHNLHKNKSVLMSKHKDYEYQYRNSQISIHLTDNISGCINMININIMLKQFTNKSGMLKYYRNEHIYSCKKDLKKIKLTPITYDFSISTLGNTIPYCDDPLSTWSYWNFIIHRIHCILHKIIEENLDFDKVNIF